MRLPVALGCAAFLSACSPAESTPDASASPGDAHVEPDSPASRDTGPLDAAADESAESICPRYDAHARECFGEMTGEDFLAECFSLYDLCSGTLPAVVRCRLASECSALGSCTGMGC